MISGAYIREECSRGRFSNKHLVDIGAGIRIAVLAPFFNTQHQEIMSHCVDATGEVFYSPSAEEKTVWGNFMSSLAVGVKDNQVRW